MHSATFKARIFAGDAAVGARYNAAGAFFFGKFNFNLISHDALLQSC